MSEMTIAVIAVSASCHHLTRADSGWSRISWFSRVTLPWLRGGTSVAPWRHKSLHVPVFRRLFDRLPVRISTSDLHHWILRKKLYHIRAYDFGVQFSFKISRNWSSSFVGRLCACLKNQTFERQWKMCSTGLNACNLGYGVSVHESAIVVMANMANTVKLYKWYGDRVEKGESCKPRLNLRPEKWFFPDPRFPQKSPQMGEGQFFPPLPQKMPILFHSGNKRQFKLSPKSVWNYQNQLVEAEKLFKKSHIFAWFHCILKMPEDRHQSVRPMAAKLESNSLFFPKLGTP